MDEQVYKGKHGALMLATSKDYYMTEKLSHSLMLHCQPFIISGMVLLLLLLVFSWWLSAAFCITEAHGDSVALVSQMSSCYISN